MATDRSFRSWLSLKENPLVDRIRKSLEIQRKRLETRYGKRRADAIVATALATGLIPIPGFQIASILALMGISEVGRIARKGSIKDEESRKEAEKVAEIARNELLEKI
jgi:energy-converting hydrogenase Eha subunit H